MDRNITFIIQGVVIKEYVRQTISMIRKYFPKSKIILSTWNYCDIDTLEVDKSIQNDDPGYFYYSLRKNEKINNINRQIVSTLSGLNESTTKYSFKLRTDFRLTGNIFLAYFNKFQKSLNSYKIFKHKVIVPSLFTRSAELSRYIFHPSDIAFFGRTDDLINYFNIPLMTETDAYWDSGNSFFNKFVPEQYLFVSLIKKSLKPLSFYYYNNNTEYNKNEYVKYLLSNFIILNFNKFPLTTENPNMTVNRNKNNFYDIYTQEMFVKKYNNIFSENISYSADKEDEEIRLILYKIHIFNTVTYFFIKPLRHLVFLMKKIKQKILFS